MLTQLLDCPAGCVTVLVCDQGEQGDARPRRARKSVHHVASTLRVSESACRHHTPGLIHIWEKTKPHQTLVSSRSLKRRRGKRKKNERDFKMHLQWVDYRSGHAYPVFNTDALMMSALGFNLLFFIPFFLHIKMFLKNESLIFTQVIKSDMNWRLANK